MKSTLSRSISSCALVLAPAGLPPVSADDQLDLAAGEHVVPLLEEDGDALLHLDAALGERPGLDREQADADGRVLRKRRRPWQRRCRGYAPEKFATTDHPRHPIPPFGEPFSMLRPAARRHETATAIRDVQSCRRARQRQAAGPPDPLIDR